MRLKDKVILITGSSTGIGKATAELCVKEGAKLIIHGLDQEESKETARELAMPYLAIDLKAADSAKKLIDFSLQQFGRLDGLVNNAATVLRTNLATTDSETFDFVINTNLRAPLLLIREAMPYFQAQKKAVVVNIGSVNAYCGQADLLAYSIAKAGLMTMTRNLANSFAKDGVRINQLNLGWVLSENEKALQIAEGQATDWYQHLPTSVAPRGALLEPNEVARHVVFWLSDESAPANGSVYELEQFPFIGRLPPKD